MDDDIKLTRVIEAIDQSCANHPNVNFCTEGIFNIKDLELTIHDFGQLKYPVNSEVAEQLVNLSSLATYHNNPNEVNFDLNVRNTHMISSSKLYIIFNNFKPILDHIASTLGLGKRCLLEPQLENCLIYKEGQFFDYHKDLEKHKDMIATLVIALPSDHTGGDLSVQHKSKTFTFSSDKLDPATGKFIAFYSDCRHKVEPVERGYRIVLTFCIILRTRGLEYQPEENKLLQRELESYFDLRNEMNPFYFQRNLDKRKLIYILDYEYTEDGLKRSNLKGLDFYKVSAVATVAYRLKLHVYLSQVDIEASGDSEKYVKLLSLKDMNGSPKKKSRIIVSDTSNELFINNWDSKFDNSFEENRLNFVNKRSPYKYSAVILSLTDMSDESIPIFKPTSFNIFNNNNNNDISNVPFN